MKIEVCGCCIEEVVRGDLRSTLENLEHDRKKRKTKDGTAVFDLDQKRDIEILDEHIAAMKLVLRYYGET
jgi:hypothetical protein